MYSFPVYLNISPAPEKPGKYLKTPFWRRRSIYTCFSGAGEVLIYTYLALEKPEKYLYTPCKTVEKGLKSVGLLSALQGQAL